MSGRVSTGKPDIGGVMVATTLGGTAGALVVSASGFTAVGAVGGGAGIGAAAGPVGVVVGGLAGLAVYGLCRAVADGLVPDPPKPPAPRSTPTHEEFWERVGYQVEHWGQSA